MSRISSRVLGLWIVLIGVAGCGGTDAVPPAGAEQAGAGKPPARGGLILVGFDASPPLLQALKACSIQGLVVQNPYRMGELSVRTLIDHLEGKPVEKSVSTGETLVTAANMDTPEVRPLIEPPKVENTRDSSAAGKKAKKWRVMVIPKGTTHEFWKSIHAGALAAAEALGNVEIYWKGPQDEDDRSEQITLVDNAAAAGVDGIVLAPLDAKAMVPPVHRAIDKGVPVVIMDSALDSDRTAAYVATDNYHGGVLAAQCLADALKGEGRIILMRYMVGSASTEEREKGFTETIKKYPKITYLSEDQYAGATSETAQKTSQSLVARYRGQIDGIFCPNESSTAGMLRALREAGLLAPRR